MHCAPDGNNEYDETPESRYINEEGDYKGLKAYVKDVFQGGCRLASKEKESTAVEIRQE